MGNRRNAAKERPLYAYQEKTVEDTKEEKPETKSFVMLPVWELTTDEVKAWFEEFKQGAEAGEHIVPPPPSRYELVPLDLVINQTFSES